MYCIKVRVRNPHPILWTHLLRCARGGERTSSHDSMRDAVYHIIRESRHHVHRERTGFLPSSPPGGRGGRVDILISHAAVGHTLVDIVVADPTLRDLVERAARHDLVAATEGRKPTIAQQGRNLCPLFWRRTVHCLIGRIDFWSSISR